MFLYVFEDRLTKYLSVCLVISFCVIVYNFNQIFKQKTFIGHNTCYTGNDGHSLAC